jgi:type IV pilus assembly protein PilC
MTTFTYRAIEAATGRETTGSMTSVAEETAVAELKTRGLYPTAITQAEAAGEAKHGAVRAMSTSGLYTMQNWRIRKPAGRRERVVFTRQLAVLVAAGMPLVRSLDLLARQERNPAWRAVITGVADSVRSGGTLADGLMRHPEIFDRLYIGMIRAGESGGRVDVVLERLARHLERSGRLELRVRSAMTYPLVIMSVAVLIVAALMTLVVPRFEKIFSTVLKGAPLPALTGGVLNTSRFVQAHWLVLLGMAVLAAGSVRWLLGTGVGERTFDRLILRLPVAGDLFLKTAVARFSRTLGTMLVSGVPVLQALQLTRDACGNRTLAASIGNIARRVREGEGVALPLAESGVFPVVVAGMVEVGEETGTLPEMLGHVADLYEEEVDNAVAGLTSLVEPAMIVLMAAVVGTIVVALFLPIIRIVQLMS